MLKTLFKFYSLATVTEDLVEGSDILNVSPTEIVTDIPGDINAYSRDLIGEQGQKITASGTIPTIWMPFGDMRETPPNVVVGEKVLIFRYGDTDAYFWTSIGRNNLLRKLEEVVFLLSNTEGEDEDATEDNQVICTLSTKQGILKLTTPGNRGEKAIYDMSIDMKNGTISVQDNKGNSYKLDSVDRNLTWEVGSVDMLCNTFHCSGDVTFDKTLLVKKDTTITANIDVSKSGTYGGSLRSTTLSTGTISCAFCSAPNKKNK